MSVEVDQGSLSSTRESLQKYVERFGQKTVKAVYECGIMVQNQMKSLMRSKSEQSISGLPPRVQTGILVNSIVNELKEEGDTISAIVGPSGPANEYAAKLEFGSSTNWPHPYARPALQMKADDCRRKIESAIKNTSAEV